LPLRFSRDGERLSWLGDREFRFFFSPARLELRYFEREDLVVVLVTERGVERVIDLVLLGEKVRFAEAVRVLALDRGRFEAFRRFDGAS